MSIERITSRQNPVVKRFRDVARGDVDGELLLDGEHLIKEALASAVAIDLAAVGERFATSDVVARLQRVNTRIVLVSDPVLRAISPVHSPSGLVAIARRPRLPVADVFGAASALVLMLHDVQDPGNVGAVVRAAEGCGATGLVCGDGTADPFGWKALRGSMGSSLRLPIVTGAALTDSIETARAKGLRVFATTARNGTPLPECDLRAPAAILLGGEGPGLPASLVECADVRLTIPMQPPVESFNVAIAAAIVLYEAARQRHTRGVHVAL